MKRTTSRALFPYLAAGLAAAVLPLGASSATATGPVATSAVDFGFSSEATASPVRMEIFEPTIPLPATPQAELNFGYTKVLADSGGGRGRASYLWPGDVVGEGAKTIIENFGLPPEVSGPLAAQGYPVQVNSNHPAGPPREAQEPFPGTVMRTSASEGKVSAATGFSSDCDVSEPASGGGDDEGGDAPAPGVPGLPGVPTGGLLGARTGSGADGSGTLTDFGAAITGQSASPEQQGSAAAAEEGPACPIPADLNALIDVGGAISTTGSVVEKGAVTTTSRAALGDIELVGGVVQISGVTAKAVTSSDGTKEDASGKARYGILTIGGQEFSFGPGGFEAVGQQGDIPGLPDEAAKALKQLGITITVPKPELSAKDKTATAVVEGLVVEVDLATLAPVLSQLPLGQLVSPLPEEMRQLKNAIGAISHLSPRIVLHLGRAASEVQRAPKIDFELPTTEPPSNNTTGDGDTSGGASGGTAGSGSGSLGGSGTAGSAPTDAGAASDAGGGDSAPSDGDLTDAAPAGAGLPPLNSIPGALLFGGIALAAVAGSYLRRIGALALGSGAACPHGLDSGLPDLRKA